MPTLRRVDPLHLEGLCSGNLGLPHLSWWAVSGQKPLVTRFLCGALRLRPPGRSRFPPWYLAVVLEALCRPPFEPIEEISDRHLTLKVTFLLAISSLKTVGDLQALSVAPTHWTLRPAWPKPFYTLEQGIFRRSPPLHHGQSYCRPSVLLPFGSLTCKSLIVCVQCEAPVLYTNKTIAALTRPSNLWQLVALHQLHNYLPHIRYVALLLPDNIETVSDRPASLCCKPQSL